MSALSFAGPRAHADRWGHHQGRSRLSFDMDFFQSSQNFTNRGVKSDLPLGGKYREVPVRIGMRHDPDSRFSFFGELGVNSVKAENRALNRERTALSHLLVGADFQLLDWPVLVVPELRMMVPLTTISLTDTEAFVGEGVFGIQSGIAVSKVYKYLWLSAYAGFDYRMSGRASLGVWNAMAKLRFWSLFLDLEAAGSSVLMDDEEAFFPDSRFNYINSVNAGSYRYYSVNPELTEARLALGIQFSPTTAARIGFGQGLSGFRSAFGQTYFLSFQMDFGEEQTEQVGGPDPIPIPEKTKVVESRGQPEIQDEEALRSKTREDLEKELKDFIPEGMESTKPRRKRK